MKKTSVVIAVLVMAVFVGSIFIAGTQTAYAKKPVLLRLVVPSPPGDWPLTFCNEDLARRFNERAKGEYVMEVHAGGALAKLPEYFDAIRIGAVEMACAPWGFYAFVEPRLGIIETPFLFATSPAASAACKDLLPLYDEILQEKFNAKALSLMNVQGVHLFSTKPVKTLEDWQGLLTGALSPPTAVLIKEMGASPVTVMWYEMYEALQKKVIDATTTGPHSFVVMGMGDVCKHATIFFGIAGWNGFSINLDVWNKMPEHIQKILQEEAIETAEWMNKIVDTKLGEDDLKAMKEKGVSVYIVPKRERDKWEKRLTPYKEKHIASFGEFGQKVQKIVDRVNRKHPYSKKGMY